MLLDWRTFYRAIGAEHATITLLGFKHGSAAFASIEKLTSVGRHGFRFPMPAKWTGNY
jgi:hypothetical protein